MPCSICGKLGHNRRTCMSFNKIQEKKSNDIISDSDSDSDNESDVLSPDVKKTLIEKIPLTHNKIKIMNKKNDSINDSEDNELCELLKTNCVVSEGKRETAKKDEEIRLKLIFWAIDWSNIAFMRVLQISRPPASWSAI